MSLSKKIKHLFSINRVASKISTLDRKIIRLGQEKAKLDGLLLQRAQELVDAEKAMTDQLRKSKKSVRDATLLNAKLEEALESTREELRTANEIVIPGLVAANETFRCTWDSESAKQVMLHQAATPVSGEM